MNDPHLDVIPFNLSKIDLINSQFQFPPHSKLYINVITGTVSPNGKFIAFAVKIRHNATHLNKYFVLIKNIFENYIHSIIYINEDNDIDQKNYIKFICWHPSSKWLAYVNENYLDFVNIVMVWNIETNNLDGNFSFKFEYNNLFDPIPINYLQWIDNGTKLLVSFENTNLTIIDIITLQILKKINFKNNTEFISIGHLFSKYVLILNTYSVLETNQLSLQLWDYNFTNSLSLKSILLENDTDIISSFSLSPDKLMIACGSSSKHISLYNIENLLNDELTNADIIIPITKKLNNSYGCGFFRTKWMPNSINLLSVGYEICLWNTITCTLLQTIRTNYINTKFIKSISFIQNYNSIYIINCSSTNKSNENIMIYDPLILHKKTILTCQLIKYRLIRPFKLRLPHELWDLIINDFGLSTMI